MTWALACFVTLVSVIACMYLMIAMSKLPDQDSAKFFILKMGLTFKFPLLCFGFGVICLSPLGCILWTFTELYWTYALITTGVCWATMAVALCWATHMLGALHDTVAAVRDAV